MVHELLEESKKMKDAADEIFLALKDDKEQLTVDDLLSSLDEGRRDVIEEICVALFRKHKKDKDPK